MSDPCAVVVDDDVMLMLNASDILTDFGFQTFEASNGEQARKILEQYGSDVTLLVTDVEMPRMNGFDLARMVAATWPEIEIMVCSGRVKPEDGELPPKATFIGKPFSAEVLRDHLKEMLPDGKSPSL